MYRATNMSGLLHSIFLSREKEKHINKSLNQNSSASERESLIHKSWSVIENSGFPFSNTNLLVICLYLRLGI